MDLLLPLWPGVAVGSLVVGDVRIGTRVIVERKTVHDLVQSIADGRLFRQLYALCGECSRPLLIIEGSTPLPAAGLDAESLRGILLSVAVGYRIPMLRSMGVQETAVYLARIAAREERRLGRVGSSRAEVVGPLSVLAAVPGVGEERAAALLRHFGTLKDVFAAAPSELREVPGVGPTVAGRIFELCSDPSPGRVVDHRQQT